jgi:hypothetical protein
VDPQTLRVRRAVAAGAGLIVLILLFFGVRGCLDARKDQAYKDYVAEVTDVVNTSNQESEAMFEVLRGEQRDASPVDLENAVNGFRVDAEQLVERAKELDHPGELDPANNTLTEVLEFRRDGLRGIARAVPTALGDENRTEARRRIAAQMQLFLVSDVLYTQRFVPELQRAMEERGLLSQVQIPESQFLPDIDWLRPGTVSDRLSRVSGSGGDDEGGGDESASPGLHGTGLGTVSVTPGDAQLSPDASTPTEIEAAENLAFEVQVSNQGENDERDVPVKVTLSGAGNPIELEETIPDIGAGETETVSIPVADSPPIGRAVTVEVEVERVPGEETSDNNTGEFRVVFTR